jgi:hypothetical protein
LVNVIEDWEILEETALSRLGIFQVVESEGFLEIMVLVGNVGFRREFSDEKDPLFWRIYNFCHRSGYARIRENIPVGAFFK